MHDIILIFPGALALLFLARKIARRVGLVDKPNARKHHHGNIPLVGGVSVYFSLWIVYALQPGWMPDFSAYMSCITLLLIVGVLDDRFDLPVMPRMFLQVGVAAIMIWQGLYLSTLGNILFGYPLLLGSAGYVVTVFAVIGAINAYNMIDGIDGLLGMLASITFCFLSIIFFLGNRDDLAMWCLALVVICLPYILLNLGVPWGQKFKVFMGDAGSMLIGFTVIWLLIIASQGERAIMRPVTALWIIALPVMDMLRVMIGRIQRKCSPFKPDREHLHHILLRRGFDNKSILILTGSLMIAMSATGVVCNYYNLSESVQLAILIMIFLMKRHFLSDVRKEESLNGNLTK